MTINRKCGYCKNSFDILVEETVCDKGKYYHLNCFKESKLNNKKLKLTENEIEKLAQQLKTEHDQKLKVIIDKELLYKWVQDTYNIMVLPSYFFVKMDSIYNGTFKGLRVGIPPHHILDMWKKKLNYLNKLNDDRVRKGNTMDKLGRINYDLVVIMNKYDGYLKWLADKEIHEQEHKMQAAIDNCIKFANINKTVDRNNVPDNDISTLLDEVF